MPKITCWTCGRVFSRSGSPSASPSPIRCCARESRFPRTSGSGVHDREDVAARLGAVVGIAMGPVAEEDGGAGRGQDLRAVVDEEGQGAFLDVGDLAGTGGVGLGFTDLAGLHLPGPQLDRRARVAAGDQGAVAA